MKNEDFKELLSSVEEAGQIKRGEIKAFRSFEFPEPDVTSIRESIGVSQAKFAASIGVSPRTLQNWEQGHRRPTGPARVLLKLVQVDPESIFKNLHQDSC